MGSRQRKTPQMTTVIDERLRRQAVEIASQRGEHDRVGKGLSVVVRAAVARYVARHYDLLPPDLRD